MISGMVKIDDFGLGSLLFGDGRSGRQLINLPIEPPEHINFVVYLIHRMRTYVRKGALPTILSRR